MPTQVDKMPGNSGLGALDWDALREGGAWFFSKEEMDVLGVQPETLRAFAHKMAAEDGTMKFRTKLTDEGLYLERK